MKKTELFEKVAGEVGLAKKDVNNIVDAVTSAITDSLAGWGKATLVGFGTFRELMRKARQSVYPQTRTRISLLGKGIVVGDWVRVFLQGMGILTKKDKVAIAQEDSFLRCAEAMAVPVTLNSC